MKRNTIQINETELKSLIRSCVNEAIDEAWYNDKEDFKNGAKKVAKKVGKGIVRGALGTAALAGAVYGVDRGLEKDYQYGQKLNRDAVMLSLGKEEDIQKYLKDNNLEDNEQNRREADEYFNQKRDAYFDQYPMESVRKNKKQISEARLNNIISKSIKKVLRESSFDEKAQSQEDIDKLGKEFIHFNEKQQYTSLMFIHFIEKHEGGKLLQMIVDYESGNETGEPISPVPMLISEFELCYNIKCTPEMKQAIRSAYNEWWYYAKPQLMQGEE